MSIIILSLTKCTKMVGIFINFASLLMYVWKTVLNFVGLFSLWNKVIFLLKGYNEYGGWACLEAILVEKFHHVCKEMVWIFFFEVKENLLCYKVSVCSWIWKDNRRQNLRDGRKLLNIKGNEFFFFFLSVS